MLLQFAFSLSFPYFNHLILSLLLLQSIKITELICLLAKSESTLIVTPTQVVATAYSEDRPTIGIEGLFQNFEKPTFSKIEDEPQSGGSFKGKIQPTSVQKYKKNSITISRKITSH